MPKSEQQRQKKLARKKSKDQQKKRELVREKQQLASLAGKMSVAGDGKILHCMANEGESGMMTVLLSRQAPEGQVAIAIFLLDLFCLGVKDTVADYWTQSRYSESLENLVQRQGLAAIRPGLARGIVEAAVEYAASFGFSPHADYRKMVSIWGQIEAEPIEGLVEFGHNGKPFYFAGPHDDAAKQQMIMQKLAENAGQGNYDFAAGGSAAALAGLAGFHPSEIELDNLEWNSVGPREDDADDESPS